MKKGTLLFASIWIGLAVTMARATEIKDLSVNNYDFPERDEGSGQMQKPHEGQVCFLVSRYQFPKPIEP